MKPRKALTKRQKKLVGRMAIGKIDHTLIPFMVGNNDTFANALFAAEDRYARTKSKGERLK